jgi:uncharacterized protein
VSRDPLTALPTDDADVAAWTAALGLDGLIDLHVHFLPERVMVKVWAFFDQAAAQYGKPWPVHYRLPQDDRVAVLRALDVRVFAPLVYPHKPGMANWLNGWVADFAASVQAAVPTATLYPEPGVAEYLERALSRGARCAKVHVQVGDFDPRDPLLDPAWGLLAEAGVPVVVHCGHGPGNAGRFTGLDVFGAVPCRPPPAGCGAGARRAARRRRGTAAGADLPPGASGHHDGRRAVHRGIRPTVGRLAGSVGGRGRPRRVRHRFP